MATKSNRFKRGSPEPAMQRPNASQVWAAYKLGNQHLEAKQFSEAIAAFKKAVAMDPKHAPSLHHLALCEHFTHANESAAAHLERCLELEPNAPEALSNYSVILIDLKRWDDAILAARKAIVLRPQYLAAHSNLGEAYKCKGAYLESAKAYREVLKLQPDNVSGIVSLVGVLHAVGDLDEAEKVAKQSIKIAPHYPQCYRVLAHVHCERKNYVEAIEGYRKAIELNPREAVYRCDLAHVLRANGQLLEAIAETEEALRLDPQSAVAYNNKGNALKDMKRFDESMACYLEAIRIDPNYYDAYSNICILCLTMGQYVKGIEYGERAIAVNPNGYEAYANMSVHYLNLGHFAKGAEAAERAIAINPAMADAHLNLGLLRMAQRRQIEAMVHLRTALECNPDLVLARFYLTDISSHICDWSKSFGEGQDCLDKALHSGIRLTPFQVLCMQVKPEVHLQHARAWCKGLWVEKSKAFPVEPRQPADAVFQGDAQTRKIRIGYLSADFYEHATAILMAEMLELHDPSRFELYAYCFSLQEDSATRQRLKRTFGHFREIHALSHYDAASLIRQDGIDILVDLKGYTMGARTEILAYKPAPIQVNYLGYPSTMGAPFMDYILADRHIAPFEHAAYFDEKIVQLPNCYQPNDKKRAVSAKRPTRADFGLADDAFVFCSFNNTYKITKEVFDIWLRLLKAVPDSVLWLLEANSAAKANLWREAKAQGVEAKSIKFAPRVPIADHVARYPLADLFVDTLPVNAHTTASEALWLGLPVLTCMGDAFIGRVAGSVLHGVGLPELVTETLADYEKTALRLATNRDELKALRERLWLNRMTHPVFDTPRYTRNLEQAYIEMVKRYDAGLSPEAFAVADQMPPAQSGQPQSQPQLSAPEPKTEAPALQPQTVINQTTKSAPSMPFPLLSSPPSQAQPQASSMPAQNLTFGLNTLTPTQPPAKPRILYVRCPLCNSPDIPFHKEVDATSYPFYKSWLPKTMKWRQCRSCSHSFTDGYFTPEMLAELLTHTPPDQVVGYEAEKLRAYTAPIVARVAAHQAPPGDWLDVGFGNGSLLFTADEWGYKGIGLDLRAGSVEALRALGFEAHQHPIEEYTAPERFSVISMGDVLEHMPFPRQALQAARGLLKPDGVLFVAMPNMDSTPWRMQDAKGNNPYWFEIEHYHNFSRARLHKLLEENGFRPVDYNVSTRYLFGMEVIARRL